MLFLLCLSVRAQEVKDTLCLSEVVVKASRVVRRVDGQTIYPSDIQKKSSLTGYSLLQKLMLPGIRVDEMSRSIQSVANRGEVLVRINGIVANTNDMQALDVSNVISVDFIDSPGVRYGTGIGYVINIHTRCSAMGYAVGAQTMNRLTAANGYNNAYASMNNAKGQFRVFYEQGYSDTKGNQTKETANYLLTDATWHSISRNMIDNRMRSYDNSFELRYNLADSNTYVFQASFSTDLSNSPRTFSHKQIKETGTTDYIATQSDKSRSASPVLDLYYYHRLGTHQSITANAVGTYIHTLNNSFYDEGSPYSYDVDGKTYSLIGEAIYENRLKPFTLSAGMNVNWKLINNNYRGDVNSVNGIHRIGTYAHTQISGRLHGLAFMTGVGLSYERYRQGNEEYTYWLWRPKAQLSYQLFSNMHLAYSIELSQHISNIAIISDTRIRQNSMEWTVGNPLLKPNSKWEHNLTLAYNGPRVYTQLAVMYRVNNNCNLGKYVRTDDNQFLYSTTNQPHCNMLYVSNYTRVDIVPDHLSVSLSGSVNRFFNRGDDYNHCYTSFSSGCMLTSYLGKWTLQFSTDSGWRFMEAEMKGFSAGMVVGAVGYHLGNCEITAYWINPFQRNPLSNRSQIMNQLVDKCTKQFSKDMGNALQLKVVWRLTRGKSYKDIEKRLNNEDKMTGIL